MGVSCNELRTDWKLHIDAGMVLRAIGAVPPAVRVRQPRFMELVEKMVGEQQDYLRPRAAIRAFMVREVQPQALVLENGVLLQSRTLTRRLAGSESIVAVVGTIGDEFAHRGQTTDLADRLIMDGLGTAAITALTTSIHHDVRAAAHAQGLNATHALYPGMKGWELAEGQAQIFALVDGRSAGVSLNESFMMRPKKSVSFVVGIGARVAEGVSACEDCGAAAHCRHQMQNYVC